MTLTSHSLKLFLALFALSVFALPTHALPNEDFSPEFDLKTNLLNDAVGTMSLGAEVKLSRRFSLDTHFNWNPWTFSDHSMYKIWNLSPELRWWPSQKSEWADEHGLGNSALNGHFLGVHLKAGEYNYSNVRLPFNAAPGLKDNRYEGWFLGGGISYGYRYNISSRFALEAEIGMGVAYVAFNRFACGKCGERLERGSKVYVGPTRAALNLILRIGKNPRMPRCGEPVETFREVERIVEIHVPDTVVLTDTVFINAPAQEKGDVKGIQKALFTLRLQYPLSSSRIEESLGDNRAQIADIREFISRYAENNDIRIKSIDINGYASLEGPSASNLRLSEERAASAAVMIADMFPQLSPLIHACGLGEDWETPDFKGKDRLMLIPDLDERERRLRNLDGGSIFRNILMTQLPPTRRIECVINYITLTH